MEPLSAECCKSLLEIYQPFVDELEAKIEAAQRWHADNYQQFAGDQAAPHSLTDAGSRNTSTSHTTTSSENAGQPASSGVNLRTADFCSSTLAPQSRSPRSLFEGRSRDDHRPTHAGPPLACLFIPQEPVVINIAPRQVAFYNPPPLPEELRTPPFSEFTTRPEGRFPPSSPFLSPLGFPRNRRSKQSEVSQESMYSVGRRSDRLFKTNYSMAQNSEGRSRHVGFGGSPSLHTDVPSTSPRISRREIHREMACARIPIRNLTSFSESRGHRMQEMLGAGIIYNPRAYRPGERLPNDILAWARPETLRQNR